MPKNGIAHIEDGFWLDIQIDRRAGGDWVVSDEPYLTAPLDRCVRETPWGVPASAPEMVLFYKSRDMRLRDRLDFAALHPLLDERQRAWLRDAIDRAGHPWLRWLSA